MKLKHVLWALLFAPFVAIAAPAVTLSVSPATGVAPYPATLTWGSTGAVSCAASDGWAGNKAISGTQAVTIAAATKFTLTCTAADGSVTISWTPPTANTDGSALTDLASFSIYHGTTASNLTLVKSGLPAGTTSYVNAGLSSGTHVYAVTALNSANQESARSATSSAIVAGSTAFASANATIQTIPAPPTNVTTTTVAYEYRPATKSFAAIGLVPPGATCGPETKTAGNVTYCRVPLEQSLPVVWPQNRKLVEVWAQM